MGDKILLAGMRDGTVEIWRLKSLIEGNVTPKLLSLLLLFSAH